MKYKLFLAPGGDLAGRRPGCGRCEAAKNFRRSDGPAAKDESRCLGLGRSERRSHRLARRRKGHRQGRGRRQVVGQARHAGSRRPARAEDQGEERDHAQGRAGGRGLDRLRPVEHGMVGRPVGQSGRGSQKRQPSADSHDQGRPQSVRQAAGRFQLRSQPADRQRPDQRLGDLQAGDGPDFLGLRLLFCPQAAAGTERAGRHHQHQLGRHDRRSLDQPRHVGKRRGLVRPDSGARGPVQGRQPESALGFVQQHDRPAGALRHPRGDLVSGRVECRPGPSNMPSCSRR